MTKNLTPMQNSFNIIGDIMLNNIHQCCSCEKEFTKPTRNQECPHCKSGNWVEGYIDGLEPKLHEQYLSYLNKNKLCQEALTFDEWINTTEE